MRTHSKVILFLMAASPAFVWACSSDSTTDDGGVDSATDTTVVDAPKDSPPATDVANDATKDAAADVADSSSDAATDVVLDVASDVAPDVVSDASTDSPIDAGLDASSDAALHACDDGGCRTYASYCKATACECFALGSTDPDPPCDSGAVQCFVAPCANKSAVCVNNYCVIQ